MAVLLLAPVACAPVRPPPLSTCVLPSEKPMVRAELFFGRNIPGRQPLADAEWSNFAAQVITREFSDGFTVLDGVGQWRNPKTDEIIREHTKIVIVALDPSPDLAAKLDAVMDAYRRQFDQISVGIITSSVCGTF